MTITLSGSVVKPADALPNAPSARPSEHTCLRRRNGRLVSQCLTRLLPIASSPDFAKASFKMKLYQNARHCRLYVSGRLCLCKYWTVTSAISATSLVSKQQHDDDTFLDKRAQPGNSPIVVRAPISATAAYSSRTCQVIPFQKPQAVDVLALSLYCGIFFTSRTQGSTLHSLGCN